MGERGEWVRGGMGERGGKKEGELPSARLCFPAVGIRGAGGRRWRLGGLGIGGVRVSFVGGWDFRL